MDTIIHFLEYAVRSYVACDLAAISEWRHHMGYEGHPRPSLPLVTIADVSHLAWTCRCAYVAATPYLGRMQQALRRQLRQHYICRDDHPHTVTWTQCERILLSYWTSGCWPDWLIVAHARARYHACANRHSCCEGDPFKCIHYHTCCTGPVLAWGIHKETEGRQMVCTCRASRIASDGAGSTEDSP